MSTTLLNTASAAKAAAPAAGVSFASLAGMVMALLMVLALILAMAWLLRRLSGMGGQGAQSLRTVASLAVGAKERVIVVQAGETQLLLGVTAHQVTLLHQLEKPLPANAPANTFAALLAQRLGKDVAS